LAITVFSLTHDCAIFQQHSRVIISACNLLDLDPYNLAPVALTMFVKTEDPECTVFEQQSRVITTTGYLLGLKPYNLALVALAII